jgi:Fe2+ transport system protein FeoA
MSPWRDPSLNPTLANLKPGQTAAVLEIHERSQPACLRLQELGLVPGTPVRVIGGEGSLMIQVGEQKLCVHEELALAVAVLPV